jgi:hypothetical protein
VVVQVGAAKIYVAVMEVRAAKMCVAVLVALRKKERGDETQFTTKIGGKLVCVPCHFVL